MEFKEFPKIPRLSRECIITEKIDGTNASVYIGEDGTIIAGSRKRWITPSTDNFGFAKWVQDNQNELLGLGPGMHYGEWWGPGIQRGYGLKERKFSLFNTSRWNAETKPACCDVVPILYQGVFDTTSVFNTLDELGLNGSHASPGFMRPEGIVIFHVAANVMFKKTIEGDEKPKGSKE